MAVRGGNNGRGTLNNDTLVSDGAADVLRGAAGDDTLLGNGGNDLLDGGAGDDLLIGGAGADDLVGGGGRDVFRYAYEDSRPGAANRDVITYFDHRMQGDVVDLPHTFTFVTGAFTAPLQARVIAQGNAFPPAQRGALVQFDVDGNGAADFELLFRAALAPNPQPDWFV